MYLYLLLNLRVSFFDNDKGGEDVYELILLCFRFSVVDCGFFFYVFVVDIDVCFECYHELIIRFC